MKRKTIALLSKTELQKRLLCHLIRIMNEFIEENPLRDDSLSTTIRDWRHGGTERTGTLGQLERRHGEDFWHKEVEPSMKNMFEKTGISANQWGQPFIETLTRFRMMTNYLHRDQSVDVVFLNKLASDPQLVASDRLILSAWILALNRLTFSFSHSFLTRPEKMIEIMQGLATGQTSISADVMEIADFIDSNRMVMHNRIARKWHNLIKSFLTKNVIPNIQHRLDSGQSLWAEIIRFPQAIIWNRVLNIDPHKNLSKEKTKEGAHRDNVGYGPIDYTTIAHIGEHLKLTPDDVVVDYGAGLAHVVCTFAATHIKKAIGVEIQPEYAAAARIHAQNQHHQIAPVEIFEGDAASFNPIEGTIFYFFNPFGAETMDAVAKRIHQSWIENPRRIRFVYACPVHNNVLNNQPWLKKTAELKTGPNVHIWETVPGNSQ